MLTFELLYAMLLGLPARYLEHLEPEWKTLGSNIGQAVRQGADPVSALKSALQAAPYWQVLALRRSFTRIKQVMSLPGLTYRQKELLLALRTAKVASLAQLSRTLDTDRRNTYRRLAALIHKGLAIKFPRPDGVYYFPIPARLPGSTRAAVHRIMLQVMDYILADTEDRLHSLRDFEPDDIGDIDDTDGIDDGKVANPLQIRRPGGQAILGSSDS